MPEVSDGMLTIDKSKDIVLGCNKSNHTFFGRERGNKNLCPEHALS